MIKLIWKNIPPWLKKLALIAPIFSYGKDVLFNSIADQKLVWDTKLQNILLGSTLYLFIIFLIGLFISFIKIAKEYHKKLNEPTQNIPASQSDQKTRRKKKDLPRTFELESVDNENIEFAFFIKRRWLPNEVKPGREDFIKAIDISEEPICAKCKSELLTEYHYSTKYYFCIKDEVKYTSTQISQASQYYLGNFKGKVRKNYDEYWEKYVNEYNKRTNGKYEDYEDPIW